MVDRLAERVRPAKPKPRPREHDTPRRVDRVAPVLRSVPERVAAPARAPFVALVVLLLGGGLVALLLLNVALAQDSYRLHQLQKQTALQSEQKAALQQQVAARQAPAVLAKRAEGLGMVPADDPGFIDLSKGTARGKPHPAHGGPTAGAGSGHG
ncbi:MAG: hypothetical protein J2P24_18330 [Streptosporangiales bacterium]|nr:hypothetical protein [Streptosporangiales bacterium]MBO0891988.1 hypothetical protein [Acidothermales bacterium]